jgi:outer membrane biosynthesis protein TonB
MIVQILGDGLGEAAAKAVSGWKFNPAMRDGKPVPVLISIEVEFHI